MESRKISLLKAISYRIICIISMLIVTFALTRDVNQSIYITVVFQAIQTILYYLHERLWIRLIPHISGNRKLSSTKQ
ncbi:MAG: DUF2061 domain-containing protein [Bacteroidota bacterium]